MLVRLWILIVALNFEEILREFREILGKYRILDGRSRGSIGISTPPPSAIHSSCTEKEAGDRGRRMRRPRYQHSPPAVRSDNLVSSAPLTWHLVYFDAPPGALWSLKVKVSDQPRYRLRTSRGQGAMTTSHSWRYRRLKLTLYRHPICGFFEKKEPLRMGTLATDKTIPEGHLDYWQSALWERNTWYFLWVGLLSLSKKSPGCSCP